MGLEVNTPSLDGCLLCLVRLGEFKIETACHWTHWRWARKQRKSLRFWEVQGPMKQPLTHPRGMLSANLSGRQFSYRFGVCQFLAYCVWPLSCQLKLLWNILIMISDKCDLSVSWISGTSVPLAAGDWNKIFAIVLVKVTSVSAKHLKDTNSSTLQCAWAVLAWRFWNLAALVWLQYPPWNQNSPWIPIKMVDFHGLC